MRDKDVIIVSGGGGKSGGGGRAAVEAPNSLRSKQIAHVIDLLGEGEWEGLIDGPGGIYLNDVPLFTPTTPTRDVVDLSETTSEAGVWGIPGTWNFKGISVEFRHGTQAQTAIRSASSAGGVQTVNVQPTHSTPITSAITNPSVDTAVVGIQVDQLYQQDVKTGDITGYFVDLLIEARTSGGPWVPFHQDRIEGKAMSPYIREYAIDLHQLSTSGPWDVRVSRVSTDDVDSSKHSTITFLGMNLMTRDKFRYPNSVLVSLGVDASQVNNIPARAYDCKMSRVRIPTNYDPITRVYTGVWDGTFKIAWTDSPPWCLFDMVTTKRYGLGDYIDDPMMDKWALYTIGRYCDILVPDGFGGMEPRFTLNAFFQASAEAITVLQNMASVFRGILYYLNESLTAVQDCPSDSVYQFNTTNVVSGKFSYAGASGSVRHTVAMVVWNNPELNYKQDVESVEDPAGLLRFGYRAVTIQALGCTSRGQAHRLGLWALYVEQNEADIVTFSTALEGTGVQPGNIIDIYDPTRANIRLGGRVIDVVGQTVYFDKAVTLPIGTHTLSFIADDGSLIKRNLEVGGGSYDSVLLVGTGIIPSIGSIFGVQTADVMSQQFRIISIVESDKRKYDITALAYNSSKYDYIENNLVLTKRPIRASNSLLDAPINVTFTEHLGLLKDGSIYTRLTASWDQNPLAMGYMVSYKIGSGNWSTEQLLIAHEASLNEVVTGWTYYLRISAVSIAGVRGRVTETSYTVVGDKAAPPPFDVFTCVIQADNTREISFGYTTTPQPLDYLGARLRFLPGTTTDWNAMSSYGGPTALFVHSPIESNQLAIGHYTLAIVAENFTHQQSAPIFIGVDLPDTRTPASSIDDAIARIDAVASDNVLSGGEKRANEILWNQIVSYSTTVPAQGTALGITTEVTAFNTAYASLGTYLAAAFNAVTHQGVGLGGTDWANFNTDSTIDGATFRAKFDAVFDAARTLDAKIAAVTATTAVWTSVTGFSKPADNADVTLNAINGGLVVSGGGLTLASGGASIRTAASGARIELSGGTLKATNSGGSNLVTIDTNGKVEFTGGSYDPTGGFAYGAAVARVGTATNPAAIVGFYGLNDLGGAGTPGSSGGQAIKGESTAANALGVGIFAKASHGSGTALFAQHAGGFLALLVYGQTSINSTLTWNGYTCAVPAGNANLNLQANGIWGDPVTTARVNAAFGVASGAVVQGIGANVGAVVLPSAGGVSVLSTVSGVQTSGSGTAITIQSVSDERLKEDIRPETRGLAFVDAQEVISYRMRGSHIVRHGWGYQRVKKHVPESNDSLALINADGTGGVDSTSMTAILMKAVQELHEELRSTKRDLIQLKIQMNGKR